MSKKVKYKIPDKYFFRLHHVRPRFKENIEEVLKFVSLSIANLGSLPIKEFNTKLNETLFSFPGNAQAAKKTIDNWRTEISAFLGFIQLEDRNLKPSLTCVRLAKNLYFDEFFNYFLFSFQYPGGHLRSDKVIEQIQAGIKFKPCKFILELLIEGTKLEGKPFSITSEELTQCAFFDNRVTKGKRSAKVVAELILKNRASKTEYDFNYKQLMNPKTKKIPNRGDICRYAGDILDYMYLAKLLDTKGIGYYYYLNTENNSAINYHLQHSTWFNKYDKYYNKKTIINSEINSIEEEWFSYVNKFNDIEEFLPQLNSVETDQISKMLVEYNKRLSADKKVPTKIIGDYGETLIIGHEYLRTKNKSNRQHLIWKIPTPLGVGYDIQSIEILKKKRYIEVKTSTTRKSIISNSFSLTANEWDSAETLGENYYIYFLVVNDKGKKVFIIQNPVEKYNEGKLKLNKDYVVKFNDNSGVWENLLEIKN